MIQLSCTGVWMNVVVQPHHCLNLEFVRPEGWETLGRDSWGAPSSICRQCRNQPKLRNSHPVLRSSMSHLSRYLSDVTAAAQVHGQFDPAPCSSIRCLVRCGCYRILEEPRNFISSAFGEFRLDRREAPAVGPPWMSEGCVGLLDRSSFLTKDLVASPQSGRGSIDFAEEPPQLQFPTQVAPDY